MSDREKDKPEESGNRASDKTSSNRITEAEALVIERFFAAKPARNWPASDLQRRMQSSGG